MGRVPVPVELVNTLLESAEKGNCFNFYVEDLFYKQVEGYSLILVYVLSGYCISFPCLVKDFNINQKSYFFHKIRRGYYVPFLLFPLIVTIKHTVISKISVKKWNQTNFHDMTLLYLFPSITVLIALRNARQEIRYRIWKEKFNEFTVFIIKNFFWLPPGFQKIILQTPTETTSIFVISSNRGDKTNKNISKISHHSSNPVNFHVIRYLYLLISTVSFIVFLHRASKIEWETESKYFLSLESIQSFGMEENSFSSLAHISLTYNKIGTVKQTKKDSVAPLLESHSPYCRSAFSKVHLGIVQWYFVTNSIFTVWLLQLKITKRKQFCRTNPNEDFNGAG